LHKLGLFDQLFYKADQYQVISMIMGGASILAPARRGDKLEARAIANHLAARLGQIPLLRTKLIQDPLRMGTVRKIENPHFQIRDHISVHSLPAPGGYEELRHCLEELSAESLPLDKLWHWTVIDGLKGGRLAIDCRVHHALADGVGIVEVLAAMYDAEPVPPESPSGGGHEVPSEPSSYRLLRDAVAESAQRFFVRTPQFLLKKSGPIIRAMGSSVREAIATRDDPDSRFAMPEVNPTSLNIAGFSEQRSLSWKTLPLADVKAVARHYGCKVNDVGLLLFSFALEHYFAGIGEEIDFDLWCAMPLSTRNSASAEGGNQVAIGRLSLHNTIGNAIERLEAIRTDAQAVKEAVRPEKPVVDMQELADLVYPTAIDAVMYLTGKLNLLGQAGTRFSFANAIMSNVPGPPVPVYVANGVMVESIPKIPALDIIAVSGGFTSLEDVITIGFHCDGDTVEQPDLFVEGVEAGWKELSAGMRVKKKGAA
jgi:WS/DGAT/MGAT family acyltransferase